MGLTRTGIGGILVLIPSFPTLTHFTESCHGLCALRGGSSVFGEQQMFSGYIVVDPKSHLSLNSALRYWGCAIQAGARISGTFAFALANESTELVEVSKKKFSPLPFACIPHLCLSTYPDWNEILLNSDSQDARHLLSLTNEKTCIPSPVKFDPADRSITLLMPGFDKSEIKLYQIEGREKTCSPGKDACEWPCQSYDQYLDPCETMRGGSELVEAGDQRRVIRLPSQLQGKVGGAKFTDRSLVITMR